METTETPIELNPANVLPTRVTDETRVPMTLPQLTLEVPKIPGYELHWFLDRPGRVNQALRAGWVFVDPNETQLNNSSFADSVGVSGNTDLGNRVSVHGGTDDRGSALRQYLMKIKEEWYQKDMQLREETSERIAETLRAGRVGAERGSPEDAARRYVRNTENIFSRRKPKGNVPTS